MSIGDIYRVLLSLVRRCSSCPLGIRLPRDLSNSTSLSLSIAKTLLSFLTRRTITKASLSAKRASL